MSTKPTKYKATLTVTEYDDDFVLTVRNQRIDEHTTVYGPGALTKLGAITALFQLIRAESPYWRPDSDVTFHISDKVIYVRQWIRNILDGCAMATINVEDDEIDEIALRGNWDVTVSVARLSKEQKVAAPVTYFSDNRNTICAEIAAVLLKHKVAMAKASPGDAPVPTTEYGWFDWEDIEHFMKEQQ